MLEIRLNHSEFSAFQGCTFSPGFWGFSETFVRSSVSALLFRWPYRRYIYLNVPAIFVLKMEGDPPEAQTSSASKTLKSFIGGLIDNSGQRLALSVRLPTKGSPVFGFDILAFQLAHYRFRLSFVSPRNSQYANVWFAKVFFPHFREFCSCGFREVSFPRPIFWPIEQPPSSLGANASAVSGLF